MATLPPNFLNNSQSRPSLRPIRPSFLRKLLPPHVPNSTQLMGFLTLVISGGILLLLTGVTITTIILGLVFFTPLIFITSPIWIPIGILLFITAAGFLSSAFTLGVITWLYRYFTRRSMVDDQSTDDYSREFKVKDTAPGA